MKKYIKYVFLLLIFLFLVGCDKEELPIEKDPIDPIEEKDPIDPVEEKDPVEENSNINNQKIAKEIVEWAILEVGTSGIEEVKLPTTHPELGGEISFISSNGEYFDTSTGYLELVDFDEEITLKCIVKYNGVIEEKEYLFTILGYSYPYIGEIFASQLRGGIFKDINLKTEYDDYDGFVVSWSSSNTNVLTDEGIYKIPENDTTITITYNVKSLVTNVSKTFEKEVVVKGRPISEKLEEVEKWLDGNVGKNGVLEVGEILPSYCEEYDASLLWYTSDDIEIKDTSLFTNLITNLGFNLKVKVTISNQSRYITKYYSIRNQEQGDIWDKIELFVNSIHKENIENQKFILFGWEEGYTSVPTENIGYIPFYKNVNTTRIQDIIPTTMYWVRGGSIKTSTEYIVIHNTGMAHPTATAKGLSDYIHSLKLEDGYKSWHFSVDDTEIYQHLPLDEVGWHAGDGSTTYPNTWSGGLGGGNRNGIGIETCVYEGIDFNDAMRNLAKLVAELLIEYNLGFDRIKKHFDFSGKNCPQVLIQSNRWDELIYLIQLEYFAKTELKDVNFVWESLSPDVMDDTGKVINHLGEGTVINYQVTVTYKNETKVYKFSSVLNKLD